MAAFWCTFLSLLAVASMSFICGCTLSVVLAIVAAHCLYMYESMMRELLIKELQNMGDFIYFILLQCMRACFYCYVFHEMYL